VKATAPMYPGRRDIWRTLAAMKLILMVSAERRTYISFTHLAF